MNYEIASDQVRELISWAPGGDSIPHGWYRNIQRSGKPHHQAVALLGRIVYMYRPVPKQDPVTGLVIGVAQKFAADQWQQSREALASHFGFSKKEIDSALHTLKQLGLVSTELRTLIVSGQRLSNVLHIGINAQRIKEISTPISRTGDSSTPSQPKGFPGRDKPVPQQGKTNTKIPQKTAQETTTPLGEACCNDLRLKANQKRNGLWPGETIDTGVLREMVQGTRFEGITADSLQSSVNRFGVAKTLEAIDILGQNRSPLDQKNPAAYVFGALRNGLVAPENYVPFAQKKEKDAARREQREKILAQETAIKEECEEQQKRKLLAAQAAWLELPQETRKKMETLAKAERGFLRNLAAQHLEYELADMFHSGRLSLP